MSFNALFAFIDSSGCVFEAYM